MHLVPPSGARALLCFDGSPEAATAIRRARAILETRAALVLVVWTPAAEMSPLDPVGDAVGRVSGLYRDWDRIAAEMAERDATAGCAVAGEVGFRAEPVSAPGKTAATILRLADEYDVAVIVLGARGGGGLGDLGSISSRVARQARRPVLVIPRNDPPAS